MVSCLLFTQPQRLASEASISAYVRKLEEKERREVKARRGQFV